MGKHYFWNIWNLSSLGSVMWERFLLLFFHGQLKKVNVKSMQIKEKITHEKVNVKSMQIIHFFWLTRKKKCSHITDPSELSNKKTFIKKYLFFIVELFFQTFCFRKIFLKIRGNPGNF